MTVRVLLVDDQPLVRAGLRAILETCQEFTVAAEACDGAEAITAVRAHRPDVVLMDLRMPRMDGVQATTALLRAADPPRVLALTSFNTVDLVLGALRAGASGFLLKDSGAEELLAAVRSVAAGSAAMSPRAMAHLVDEAGRLAGAGRSSRARIDARLAPGEVEVLRLLGDGLTNQQIAHARQLSVASVKTYVSRILNALGLENRTQAAVLAHQAGLVTLRRTQLQSR
ncbi:response regulator transcription factor [Kitasatospora sp. NPDC089797]|uniref:response regulator transcription factor n=1 Tax=Kitasatospora sp. NPDC089797 TaxID=3155298 RepID=UPI0034348B14